ncbi:hypothetical protein [Bradyrhizobium elkanii]|uniref:hypothetical protein n=1 Tax=Bradyrhizobium elkanii TaxID=29448 RepID=UPI000841B730|nr:hypothetical protein [Bradyrhizobium elkanii]ODM80991.1 hypothetical protein A6X20_21610 [Bradyrhizobium elkanii]
MVTPHDAGLAVLKLKGIGKEFGAIRALHGVDLRVSPGEVVGNVAAEISAQAARAERHGSGPVLAVDRHRYPAERIPAAIINGAAIAFDER